ncbi:substrate-binding periplasmic protein [Aliiroseovarius sp.]|uniref:substrate-binding periplasmic protein n=1 Tax=Aliiroseovarius sp. TaxID=1872442 RepID=UPI003BABDBF4
MTKTTTALTLSLTMMAGAAAADDILVIGADLPPMMMAGGDGREAEIIRTTLERCGHSVTWELQPFTRHWASFDAGRGDAVTTVPMGMPTAGTASVAYVNYQNGVSFLGAQTPVTSLGDLAGRSVVTFQGASDILPDLGAATDSFSSYREVTDQMVHSQLLFSGRIDAVVGDGMIFAEYNRQLAANGDNLGFDPNQHVRFNATFAPSSYTMAFRNPAHAADFDRCFAEATTDGTIQAINTKWADRYRDVLGDQYMGY